MEDKGKTRDSKKLTDLWQRLSALRRHLSCLRCDELCYFDKAVTHPYLFTGNQEILFCENCFNIICKAKTLEHGSEEAREAFELKKKKTPDSEISKNNTLTQLDSDDVALISHCFDKLEHEFTDIPNLKDICGDYLTTCRAIIQLDKYFFPWNDREIVTTQDFKEISWPFLKESVDMAHEADAEDPDSEYIYRILEESMICVNTAHGLNVEGSVTEGSEKGGSEKWGSATSGNTEKLDNLMLDDRKN